ILAGAGTGKTTTITHRIGCQVRSGAFDASQILAVTFTDKAAGELRRRLLSLGVEGVEARTFHSAALSQLGRLWSSHTGEPLAEVLDHKAPLIASLANALPPPHKFLPRRELANEIEWAKNRMITPARYVAGLGARDDLCVVGDDYQTIYAFTGASPEHLLGFTRRFPLATVVRLEENYRSTPEILDLANRLAPRLGGARKTLRSNRPSGPPPI